jgi:hypothetical protein
MLKLERFTGEKTYMFPNGAVAEPATIRNHFPAVDRFTHVIEVNGDVCQAVESLAALREIHKIDSALSDDDAIAALNVIINTPAPVVISAEERLAAAAEFSNIMSLPDVVDTKNIVEEDDTIIKKNFDEGLWSTPMLDVAVRKGVITSIQAERIKVKIKRI